MLGIDAVIPTRLRCAEFVATPLTVDNAELDYAAYMASPDVIRVHSDGRWPTQSFTLADDLELVSRHQDHHERRRAFTFTVLDPTEPQALGCLYLNPLLAFLRRVHADEAVIDGLPTSAAMVTFWLRQDLQDSGLADGVVEAVNEWIVDDWPIPMHAFRVLPEERSSVRALDRLGLVRTQFDLPGEPRPYLWFQAVR